MSLPMTVALSVIVILLGIAVPALMCVITQSMRWWVTGFACWLVIVFGWILLQMHLYSLAPAYFEGSSPWVAINIWCGTVEVMWIVVSFFMTIADN